jgi:adenylate cyclase
VSEIQHGGLGPAPASSAGEQTAGIALARIHVQVLGPVLLDFGAGAQTRQIAMPRIMQAVLGYLATQPHYTVSREHMAWQLWGEVSDVQARQNLRQTLLRLKRRLADLGVDALMLHGQTIALDQRRITTDLHAFIADAESKDIFSLEKAVSAYRGSLLEGLQTGHNLFDDWLRSERIRFERLAHQALRNLGAMQMELGNAGAAVAAYERLVMMDSLNEEVHCLLLAAVAALKGRQSALRRGEQIAAIMKAELNCELEPRTMKLLSDIRDNSLPFAGEVKAAPRLAVNIPSIVVLPFLSAGNPDSLAYIADGLEEDITTALSRLKWLFVMSRNAARQYSGRQAEPRQVARALGVRYCLSGSVRVAGDNLRVTVALVDAETDQQVWTERYDRRLSDIFAVQDDIANSVLALIEPQLYQAESRRAASIPPERLDAWGLVVTAIGMIHRFERQPNERARELLERAIALEPQYARAHAVISWAKYWAREFYWMRDREQALESSLEHAEIALRLDNSEPWSHMVLGFVRSSLGHHGRALDALNTAVELNPSFALGRMLRGWAMIRAGAFADAVEETGQALRLRPPDQFGAVYQATHGLALLADKRFEDALPYLRASVIPFTEYMGHYNVLISCCGHLGLQEEAKRWLTHREKALGRPMLLARASTAIEGYAHRDIFISGLRKAGVQ